MAGAAAVAVREGVASTSRATSSYSLLNGRVLTCAKPLWPWTGAAAEAGNGRSSPVALKVAQRKQQQLLLMLLLLLLLL